MILKALFWGFGSKLIKVIHEKVKKKAAKLSVRISEEGIQVTGSEYGRRYKSQIDLRHVIQDNY